MTEIKPSATPLRHRAEIAAVVSEVLAGQLPAKLAKELTGELADRLDKLYSDLLVNDFLAMTANALKGMPEVERKAKMFDMLNHMGAFDVIGKPGSL